MSFIKVKELNGDISYISIDDISAVTQERTGCIVYLGDGGLSCHIGLDIEDFFKACDKKLKKEFYKETKESINE